ALRQHPGDARTHHRGGNDSRRHRRRDRASVAHGVCPRNRRRYGALQLAAGHRVADERDAAGVVRGFAGGTNTLRDGDSLMSRLLILVALVGMVSTVLLLAAEPGIAAEQSAVPNPSAIEQMATIPSGDLKVIESKGELLFMGGNGRFIIKGGVLYDAWNRKALRTVSDVNYSANRVDLGTMKIDIADFRPLSFGTGRKHVTVFVDPRCPWCAKLMGIIRDIPRL